jgi:hypothetical protein
VTENSAAATVGKFGLGLGVGFGVYLLIRHLGFGGAGGAGGSGAARGPGIPRPSAPLPSPLPPLPRDAQPILLWVEPVDRLKRTPRSELSDPASRARQDVVFLVIDLGSTQTLAELNERVRARVMELLAKRTSPMTLDEVIARIKAGGRDDVRLMTSGGILAGTWDDVKDALMAAGIKHWLLWKEFPADRKPGEPAKPPHWELFDKFSAVDNPNKMGHYLVEKRGTAYWNLEGDKEASPHVAGDGDFQYGTVRGVGRGYYRGHK